MFIVTSVGGVEMKDRRTTDSFFDDIHKRTQKSIFKRVKGFVERK